MLDKYGVHLDLNWVLMLILMLILPFLGLFFWLENKVYSNSNEVKGKEVVQISDEINSIFSEQDEENTKSVVIAHCFCSFCGRLSDIVSRCSRCKAALYCSNVCHDMHWRSWHKNECVEIEVTEDQEESPSHATRFLLMEPESETSKYSFNEVEEKRHEGDVYYIEGEEQNSVEFRDKIAMPSYFNGYDGCAVCGNPNTKKCSRCKAIKYCSRACQHLDWRSRHKFQCCVEKATSTQEATLNQKTPSHGDVVNPMSSYNEVEDNAYSSSSPLRLEFYSDGNTNAKALILSSQSLETTNCGQKEVEEQFRSLIEELANIRDENISLRSEREEWEMRARNSIDRLYSFRKENEHQHENELTSNAEKQAREMVNSLSQRLHCLQIAVETGVAERKKQEEYIHMLQNECAKAKVELQEQHKGMEMLKLKLDMATQFPVRKTEETRQKLLHVFSAIAGVESNAAGAEVSQPVSLSRNPTLNRQGCSICLTNEKDMAFGCGHMSCRECGLKIRKCHICRKKITSHIRLFPG
ncbi:hypothetical protein VNO77_39009 [Canavalia gladiata]|uniref:Uncharacterized protein n=1 Tax=Canavalia gladiata TaxID=3824 RepID=A0AAN9KCU7_CANGL